MLLVLDFVVLVVVLLVEELLFTARFVFDAVTTVGNFAEQKAAASGTLARGFNNP